MNYDELIDASKAYADRKDVEVSANMDVFIALVEAKINRVLKTREQTARAYTPTVQDQEYYALPPDFRGMRDIQLNSGLPGSDASSTPYEYASPEQMNVRRGEPFAGKLYYTIIARQLQVFPCIEAGLTLETVYFQKVPNLNATNSDNWMSEEHPDIYLSGMIAEIEAFAKNYDASKLWYARLTMAINELDLVDDIERWSGVALQTKVG